MFTLEGEREWQREGEKSIIFRAVDVLNYCLPAHRVYFSRLSLLLLLLWR